MSLFSGKKNSFESEVVLGKRYRDAQTGIEGVATAIAFFQYGCERVTLEAVIEGKIEEYSFDTPRCVEVETGVRPTTEKTGGPRNQPSRTGLR